MTNSNCSYTSAASCFLLGLAAGSAAALLLTPMSGVEARGRIRKGIDEGTSRIADQAEALRHKAEDLRHKGEEIVKTASTMVDSGKKRVADEQQRIANALQAGKEAYTRA